MVVVNYKEYQNTIFWKEEYDNIIFFKYTPRLIITLDIAREIVRSRLDYTSGTAVYSLIDFTNVKSVTKEARDYMNDAEGGLKGILGGAFLSKNVVATLFVNLYLKVNNPTIPAKFFTNKADALDWLLQLKMRDKS
ncbi:MAG TPA: hypothetical protein VD884_22920 [Ohtaekwangia sp.]|nr:hypothetical protein [Ohtaekwangia sp.]